MPAVVKVEGLKEIRRELKAAGDGAEKELTRALKESGRPVPAAIRKSQVWSQIPATVGNPTSSGTKARIPIRHKGALAAEFQTKGKYGATMTSKYGGVPRLGYKGLDSVADQVVDILEKEMQDLLKLKGWAT